MKKLIKIYLDNNVIDYIIEDNKKIKDYGQDLVNMFSSDKINILELNDKNNDILMIRPSKIVAIKISDDEED